MADPPNRLRVTDFLPSRFQGETIDSDLARAHYLAFTDYINAQGLQEPENPEEIQELIEHFKRTLRGQARLWIEGKEFHDLINLRDSFLARFSPSTSYIARSQTFKDLFYVPGDTAEVHLAKISKLALPLGYNEQQICDKFLSSLPAQCRSAVLMSSPVNAPLPDLVNKVQCYIDLHKLESQVPQSSDISMGMLSTSSASQIASESNASQVSSSEITDLCHKIEALEARIDANSDGNSARQSPNRDFRQDTRRQSGNRGESRFNRREPDFTRPNVICYKCGNPGHFARECALNAQRSNPGQSEMQWQRTRYQPNNTMQGWNPPQSQSNCMSSAPNVQDLRQGGCPVKAPELNNPFQ